MSKKELSPLPFFLAALSELLARLLSGNAVSFSAREGIFGAALVGVGTFLALAALSLLDAKPLLAGRGGLFSAFWLLVVLIGLLTAAGSTLVEMLRIYRAQFSGGALWLVLLAAGLVLLVPQSGTIERASHAVFVLAVGVGILIFLGLFGQMHWQSLSFAPIQGQGVAAAAMRLACFVPEYFALPIFTRDKRAGRIPAALFAGEAAVLVGAELVFGYSGQDGRYPGLELLRAWGLGAFSRLDALVVGLWLLLALFRLLLIAYLFVRCLRLMRHLGRRGGKSNAA
ncbi:MAG: hypothetical protein LKJ90_09135 [Faecalibacterium sp.]|jgi:hypothetical protein|nr:hypothetical protein [Faecalibacterium sp.]